MVITFSKEVMTNSFLSLMTIFNYISLSFFAAIVALWISLWTVTLSYRIVFATAVVGAAISMSRNDVGSRVLSEFLAISINLSSSITFVHLATTTSNQEKHHCNGLCVPWSVPVCLLLLDPMPLLLTWAMFLHQHQLLYNFLWIYL